jgi:AGCS family alanine or glycine:cation symporter
MAVAFSLFASIAGFGIGNMAAGTLVLALNAEAIPAAFSLIFTHAFTPTAATGGFAGAAVWAAILFGVARGVFSNEAGLGSAPLAHAAALCKGPLSQGLVAMLVTFIDTIIVAPSRRSPSASPAHGQAVRRLLS